MHAPGDTLQLRPQACSILSAPAHPLLLGRTCWHRRAQRTVTREEEAGCSPPSWRGCRQSWRGEVSRAFKPGDLRTKLRNAGICRGGLAGGWPPVPPAEQMAKRSSGKAGLDWEVECPKLLRLVGNNPYTTQQTAPLQGSQGAWQGQLLVISLL